MSPRFVIQEHEARAHNFDFRLEKDGVRKSWAVPKGVPEEPGTKRLAVQVEGYPLEYAGFEGTIPTGHYGAGTVSIWDSGHYECHEWEADKIVFTLHGRRLDGTYRLVRFKGGGPHSRLFIKQRQKPTSS